MPYDPTLATWMRSEPMRVILESITAMAATIRERTGDHGLARVTLWQDLAVRMGIAPGTSVEVSTPAGKVEVCCENVADDAGVVAPHERIATRSHELAKADRRTAEQEQIIAKQREKIEALRSALDEALSMARTAALVAQDPNWTVDAAYMRTRIDALNKLLIAKQREAIEELRDAAVGAQHVVAEPGPLAPGPQYGDGPTSPHGLQRVASAADRLAGPLLTWDEAAAIAKRTGRWPPNVAPGTAGVEPPDLLRRR